MSPRRKREPGAVVQIELPNNQYAYGRIYKDAGLAIYRHLSNSPDDPPIGSRDFQFIVGAYDSVFRADKCKIVGRDPFAKGEDPWPPPQQIVDPITGECSIYFRGKIRPAGAEECKGLEIAAVWNLDHIIDRILNGKNSRYLQSLHFDLTERRRSVQ